MIKFETNNIKAYVISPSGQKRNVQVQVLCASQCNRGEIKS